jgi:hypothetical protein
MTPYEYWQRYGTLISVNGAVVSLIVMLLIRGAWGLSGAAILTLLITDTLLVSRIRRKSEASGQTYAGSGRWFFLFYGCVLAIGGIVRLVLQIREGIHWVDLGVFLILALLATAMLSIAKRLNSARPKRIE